MNDTIEFYDGNRVVASVQSSMVPIVGSFISIRKETWEVRRVTYALDHADRGNSVKGMRANVDLRALNEQTK
jgi:hypothetical protein